MSGRPRHGWLRRRGPLTGILVAAALALAAPALPAMAGEDLHEPGEAIEAGDIVPLDQFLARVRQDFGGRVLKVELEREGDDGKAKWVYEAKLLTPEGSVLEVAYDAASLELLDLKGHYKRGHGGDDDD